MGEGGSGGKERGGSWERCEGGESWERCEGGEGEKYLGKVRERGGGDVFGGKCELGIVRHVSLGK